jgi:general secretion pathway protein I
MKVSPINRGFTLIEVVVALFILSLVLSSAIFSVHQYADERVLIRDRFLANQVAWNNLMERYQHSKKWSPKRLATGFKTKGVDEQGGQSWQWEMKIEKANGQDIYRYEVEVGSAQSDSSKSSLVVYLVGK